MSFIETLSARAASANSLLCVGLDPHGALLTAQTAEAAEKFCISIIDATAEFAAAFKPNSAFFEQFGAEGFAALRKVIAHVPAGIPVILDAKRGDIASTAEAYAHAAFELLGAHAITLSPYLGRDSVEPFLRNPTHGAFILCKTSNAGASEFQDLVITDESHEMTLFETVAHRVVGWNSDRHTNQLGLVVGATDIEALTRVRHIAPDLWFLVPGIGAQGGELKSALRVGLRKDGSGLLISASRSIALAIDPRTEAQLLRDKINSIRDEIAQAPADQDQPDPRLMELAKALADAGCVKFGSFTLKSGATSPIYLDLRRLVSFPKSLAVVGRALTQAITSLTFDHLAAIPYAALPIATAASLQSGRSLIYPRREAKEYGTKVAVEGVFKAGEVALLIDDLATTGESKFEAVEKLKAVGLTVNDIVVVIDREQGAGKVLEETGYRYHAVATISALLGAWQSLGVLNEDQRRDVETYIAANRG